MVSAGLLILRLVVGLTVAAHGAQKLLAWFNGAGMVGVRGMMTQLQLKPARLWGYTIGVAELFGGLLVAVGLLTPIAGLVVFGGMLTAVIVVHLRNGFFNAKGGIEFPLVVGTVMFALAATGPGLYSLDAVLGIDLVSMPVFVITLMVVLAGVVAALVSRHLVEAPRERRGEAGRPA